MDHLVFLLLNCYSSSNTYICTDYEDTIFFWQCDEILGIIEGDDNIDKWMDLLKAGKVHCICGLSVDGATYRER